MKPGDSLPAFQAFLGGPQVDLAEVPLEAGFAAMFRFFRERPAEACVDAVLSSPPYRAAAPWPVSSAELQYGPV